MAGHALTAGAAVRLAVLASAALALAVQLALVGRAYPLLLVLPMVSTAIALAAWTRWPGPTRGAVLALAAVSPALIRLLWGAFDFTNGGVWIAPLLAVAAADSRRDGWALPRAWALPLAFWGLCVSLAWPVVIMREADFVIAALTDTHTAITSRGVPVPVAAAWIAHVAAAQLAAIIWADALCRVYRRARHAFERDIVSVLVASLLLSAGVGLYQMLADPTFLNPTAFGSLNRAAGLFVDGNAYGILMAILIPVLFALGLGRGATWRGAAALVAMLCLVCVWGSGSRTALLAAGCAIPLALASLWATARSTTARVASAAAALALLIGVGAAAWAGYLNGPRARIELVFERSWAERVSVVDYLRKRDGYGPAALKMIEEHPLVGVGVGSFHFLVLDYSEAESPDGGVGSDNAQNWLRHVVAEFGALGSLGAVTFALVLGFGFLRPVPLATLLQTWLVRSALIGVGAASLLGVPTQHAFVLIVFFTLVVWQQLLARRDEEAPRPFGRWVWTVAVLLAIGFAAGTYAEGRDALRVPHRAARFGWPFLIGYYGLEAPEGAAPFRWTQKRSLAAAAVPRGYLKLTYAIGHEDAAERPVRLRIWRDREVVVDESIADRNARTVYLYVKGAENGVVIETEVDRLWTSHGRELGVAIAEWEVVARPPAGARVIN